MSIFSILTKGWLLRGITICLVLFAFALTFIDMTQRLSTYGVSMFLFIANFYLLGTVGHRVVLLSQYNMAKVIPNYYRKLKFALSTVVLLSLLTATAVLPNVVMMFSMMTWLLVFFVFLAISYLQPKIWLVFSLLWLVSVFSSFETTAEQIQYWLFKAPAYLLPLFFIICYQLIKHLDNFKMSKEMKIRFSTYSSLSMANSLNSMDKMPEKSRPKFQQWMINNNLMVFRKLLRSNGKISKLTLIDMAISGVSRFGRSTFIGWSITIGLFCLYQYIYPLSAKAADTFYMVCFGLFSVSILAMGSMLTFFSVNERKGYLSRLRLMPLFHSEQEFSRLVLKVFFINQGKLLLFTMLSSWLVISLVWPESANLLINTLVINVVSFCFFSALALLGWHTKKQVKTAIVVAMVLLFIMLIPTAMISYDQNIFLLTSDIFNGVMITGLVLLVLALIQWQVKAPTWQTLT